MAGPRRPPSFYFCVNAGIVSSCLSHEFRAACDEDQEDHRGALNLWRSQSRYPDRFSGNDKRAVFKTGFRRHLPWKYIGKRGDTTEIPGRQPLAGKGDE